MNSTESSSKVNQTFDAAVSLFIQDPHKLTARNIAKKAHNSTQPIYSYYQSVPRLHKLVARHIVNILATLSYTIEFNSSIDLAIWYFNQCPSLATEILDNNIDLLEYLTNSINQISQDTNLITQEHLIMLAETKYLYYTLSNNESSVVLTKSLNSLYQNLKHLVSPK